MRAHNRTSHQTRSYHIRSHQITKSREKTASKDRRNARPGRREQRGEVAGAAADVQGLQALGRARLEQQLQGRRVDVRRGNLGAVAEVDLRFLSSRPRRKQSECFVDSINSPLTLQFSKQFETFQFFDTLFLDFQPT